MAVNKYDITDWITKCKNRAIDSVDEDITQYLSDLLKEFPKIQKDYELLEKLELIMQTMDNEYNSVSQKVYGLSFDKEVYCYSLANDYRTKIKGANALVYAYIIKNEEQYSEYYQHIQSLFEKRKKVEREYESLRNIVIKKRKVESMIKYLNELGFDTTTLMTLPSNINKDLLFVCHDNKPKQEEES